jgi:hypothetical protein
MDFAADLSPLYADFAVDVTLTPTVGSPSSGRAIHDHPGQAVIAGEAFTTEHALRYPVATFPAVKQGDTFAIGGQNYITTDAPLTTLDGLECTVPLARTGT